MCLPSNSVSRNKRTNKNKKRLVVLSDGTWQTPENPIPTNILKLTMAIEQESKDGIQQVIFYDAGIGTSGALDKLLGGGFGEGIDINIQELYTFLALNYDEGDEIYLFGFSRGSYTVRSVCGLIYESGLVRRDHIQFVKEAYDLYREDVKPDSDKATKFRKEHGDRVPITLLACFDTVGSLGLPLEGPGFLSKLNKGKYEFHNTQLNPTIQNAIHMLSIDEDRTVFSPTLMEAHGNVPNQLTQIYFWGGHGGVGGGDSRQITSAEIALRFCVDEMKNRKLGLALDMQDIPEYGDPLEEGEKISSSVAMKFIATVTGKYVRPIPSINVIHPLAIKRYQIVKDWRPAALKPLHDDLMNAFVEI